MTKPRVLPVLAAAVVALLIGGCATKPPSPASPQKDSARVALEAVLAEADKAPAHTLSADAKAPEAALGGGLITIRSYQNDASKLIGRLAAARNLKFSIQGPEPRLPLFVSIDVVDVTFEELLRQVALQCAQRADIVLTDGAVEIRYRGA